MTKKERDTEIRRLYLKGLTGAEIAGVYGISAQRVYQILQLHKEDKFRARQEVLGVPLSENVKVALRQEADRRHCSMSELTSEWISSRLSYCGYEVTL